MWRSQSDFVGPLEGQAFGTPSRVHSIANSDAVTVAARSSVPKVLCSAVKASVNPGSTDGRRCERRRVGAMASRGMRWQTRRLLSVSDEASVPRWGRAVGENRWSQVKASRKRIWPGGERRTVGTPIWVSRKEHLLGGDVGQGQVGCLNDQRADRSVGGVRRGTSAVRSQPLRIGRNPRG